MTEDSRGSLSRDPVQKVPVHPEDYTALLEWMRAKEGWKRGDRCKNQGREDHEPPSRFSRPYLFSH